MANEASLRILLVLLLALPALAAALVALLGPGRIAVIRGLSLAVVALNLFFTVVVAIGFVNLRSDSSAPTHTFKPEIVPGAEAGGHATTWRLFSFDDSSGVDFYLGVDGINVWLLLLTSLLMVSAVLISWNSIKERANEYYAWLLLLGTAMLGVFLAFDIILFYIFFELTLVPLFFLIGIWGGPQRRHAARKFFIVTLAGSVITFLGLLLVVVTCYDETGTLTFSIPQLVATVNYHAGSEFWKGIQIWVFVLLLVGFAIKVPLVPVHTWLPLAHVEAPTAGSVLLAGVLLKIGSYGFLRLALPLAPYACWTVGLPVIGILSVIGILYGAFCALSQDDVKKLVAYSSVSHMGFCMLGMFSLNYTGLSGSLLQMINHGLSTGALFLLVGMLYDRYHTRKMADYGGMGQKLKLLTVCMVFICLTSVGLPGLNGFVGEALVFFGMFTVNIPLAVIGTAGIVLGAWYLLNMLRKVFFGPVKEPKHEGEGPVHDLNLREWVALAPIMILCLVLGVYPQPVIDTARPDLQLIAGIVQASKPGAANDATKPSSAHAHAHGNPNGE